MSKLANCKKQQIYYLLTRTFIIASVTRLKYICCIKNFPFSFNKNYTNNKTRIIITFLVFKTLSKCNITCKKYVSK